jgi:hypothetical protein
LDEQAFRVNNQREANDFDRFKLAASQIAGKRITYRELSGKGASTRPLTEKERKGRGKRR